MRAYQITLVGLNRRGDGDIYTSTEGLGAAPFVSQR